VSARTSFFIFNILGLQITWAACAYGATHSQPHLGLVIAIIYITLHMLFTQSRKQDLLILLCVGIIGISLDHINTYLGFVSFNESNIIHSFIPLWLMSLWLVFSLTLPHSLDWLGKKPWLAFLLGGFGGSSSYWLGHKLGAITLSEPLAVSISIYFLQWAILLLIAYRLLNVIRRKLNAKILPQTN
jgi:hypothetical protein